MKKKLGLLLSVLLVVPIILTGCGRDGKKLLEKRLCKIHLISNRKRLISSSLRDGAKRYFHITAP